MLLYFGKDRLLSPNDTDLYVWYTEYTFGGEEDPETLKRCTTRLPRTHRSKGYFWNLRFRDYSIGSTFVVCVQRRKNIETLLIRHTLESTLPLLHPFDRLSKEV